MKHFVSKIEYGLITPERRSAGGLARIPAGRRSNDSLICRPWCKPRMRKSGSSTTSVTENSVALSMAMLGLWEISALPVFGAVRRVEPASLRCRPTKPRHRWARAVGKLAGPHPTIAHPDAGTPTSPVACALPASVIFCRPAGEPKSIVAVRSPPLPPNATTLPMPYCGMQNHHPLPERIGIDVLPPLTAADHFRRRP